MLGPGLPMWLHIRPLLWYATFSSSPISFTLFWLPPVVRTRVLIEARASGYCFPCRSCISYATPCPTYVRSPWMLPLSCRHLRGVAAQLLTCYYYANYLKGQIIHFPLPWTQVCGGFLRFSETPALHPITLLVGSPTLGDFGYITKAFRLLFNHCHMEIGPQILLMSQYIQEDEVICKRIFRLMW